MKKIFLVFFLAICASYISNAQDVPYSKYLDYDKADFKENQFKYNEKTNTWTLRKISGLNTTLNILAIIADADEEVRPDPDDYIIMVQFGKDDIASYVKVLFYKDDTYHKLLTFLKSRCQDMIETSSGKRTVYSAYYGDLALELNMEQHLISRTSSYTADSRTVKNVDESYNEYEFTIKTGVEPWSKYLEKEAERQAKRDAKGKKKQSVDDLM